MDIRNQFNSIPVMDKQHDLVWQCKCGSSAMFLRQSGNITCGYCHEDNGQEWDWRD